MTDDLKHFVEDLGLANHLRVESELGDGFVRLCVAEAERRQARHDIRSSEDILIELLRNSRDAQARHIYIATSRQDNNRIFVIIDDGCGVPEHLQERVFEARVTSKLETIHEDSWGVHGRGMALYSIRCNTEESTILSSRPQAGCALKVRSSLDKVRERTEQSALPTLTRMENKSLKITGPKNINRLVAEFSLLEQDKLEIYLGSATEIAATLRAHLQAGKAKLNSTSLDLPEARREDALVSSSYPACSNEIIAHIAQALADASDAESFASAAQKLGLDMSSRSAHRILKGSIEPLQPFISTIPIVDVAIPSHKLTHAHLDSKPRKVKLKPEDLDQVTERIEEIFTELAQSYYLDEEVRPQIKQKKSELVISIPLRPSC